MEFLVDPLVLTFVILGGAMVLFLSDRLRPDLVALLVVVALGATGVLEPREAFSGFSRSAVITLMGIFVIAESLRRTGLTDQVGVLLLRVAGHGEGRLVVTTMAAGAFLSLFMNNVAAVSVLLPAVSGAARRARVHPARLLMPLAFGTILGGMATLLTSANIVVSSLLGERGLGGFGLLSFAPVGLVLVAAGIAYMAVWGRQKLPTTGPAERLAAERAQAPDLVRLYRLDERLFRARVPPGSTLDGKPLSHSALRDRFHVSVVGLERDGRFDASPAPDTTLRVGDILLFEGSVEEFRAQDVEPYLEILPARRWREQDLESERISVAEAMLSPRSGLLGKTLREAHFREKYSTGVLAIWRAGEQILDGVSDVRLAFGDALLLQGPRSALPVLRDDPDLILLAYDESATPTVRGKSRTALVIALTTLVAAGIHPGLIGTIMLGGALAMMLTNVITSDQAYAAISWRSVFVVAGMLPLGLAMMKTGAATLLAERLVAVVGPGGPLALLAGLFVLAMLMVQTMNGSAVASVVAPIGIQAAAAVGADPRSLAMGVALAVSMAFLTPLGHPVNLLVMGPGNYKFRDFFRVGLPLSLLLFAVTMFVLPIFWPLTAAHP
jgi:di/tricarboxylate transporter